MKVSVQRARSLWFVYLNDLNPQGLNLLPLFQPLIARYNFQLFPTKPEELFGKEVIEIKFSGGSFQKDAQHNIGVELIIFNWGLVAETKSSTIDSDAFLGDLLNWASIEFKLVPYQEVLRSRAYVSEVWARTDKKLNSLNSKLEKLAKRITSLIEGHGHHPITYETSGILFSTDPAVVNPPGSFRFERIIDVPFSENRYYSAAPLQTDAHVEILTELENILSS